MVQSVATLRYINSSKQDITKKVRHEYLKKKMITIIKKVEYFTSKMKKNKFLFYNTSPLDFLRQTKQ